MEGNVFIGNVFFALIGAAMAALGIVKCRRKKWYWLLCSVVGVAIILAMMFDYGGLTYSECLLWLVCIINFGMWFAIKPLRRGWMPVVAVLPIVSAMLVVLWSPLWWICVIGGTVINVVLSGVVNEYARFKEKFWDISDDDF